MSKHTVAGAALVLAVAAGAAQAEPVTIAALGDSLTQGYGLPQQEGFVPQLQGWLDEAGLETELINAGVSGDTTAGGLARVGWTLTEDVDAMIVALGGNDFLRGIDPANSRANLRGILEAAEAAEVEVLIVGLESGPNYGPEFKQAFDSMYPDLAREFGAALVPDFFDGLQAAADGGDLGAFMQSDGLHPNARGVSVIVEAIGPAVAELARAASD
ncbi:arylesterase [Ponticoccus sp. SC2-23]|uniref:arylesterase n=1 Tax=Alexandriicola marinus TaxID=2081710 RepID=UPI000FD81E9F|nr:arylesterase [Alexandriicola marinus]MBM1221224.1 arylesterase [Ponticoccus sp. SC6-9]MBM1225794.1 arylesterase [Ponticoccus sp. SC6-15]MBM1227946.1 arylesterase [Ponticoccus sp. SC6-38]MBM1234416.1 arylesterase [Ponticoccus sp. SC6-45]MBM1238448.1 arylesterase [Ponticoccus sp. SC6-49]MBM1243717.1 arylesterase [Ponticoccus sp. SC2-64]MBM1247940.1 arylesterase [Ponticoccus sp. SC6-42]MBM1252848.1 arylesterase [Ponticoccus sp. SC6-33]MBM1256457.1 arylesterase [Ponticoccus sp. SC6-60]MBM1